MNFLTTPMRARIVQEARSYLGATWRHQGRTLKGIDCAGLIVVVGRALCLVDYDNFGYQRRAAGFDFVKHFKNNLPEKSLKDIIPGDVVLFSDGGYPCHCGILGWKHGQISLIHAFARRRKVVEDRYTGGWSDKALFAFSFPGTEDSPWQC